VPISGRADPLVRTVLGSKLPRCEGKYRINYVIDGDPWSPEQTIAHHGPEFSMVAEDKQGP